MSPVTVVSFENVPSDDAKKWIALYQAKGNPNAVLMNRGEIADFNRKIRKECPTMHDMEQIPHEILGSEVAWWISRGKSPAAEKLDRNGNAASKEQLDRMEANRNLSAVPQTVIPKTAVVTRRTNLRTLPTEERLYDTTDCNRYFDRLQETELILGTPVLLLHESSDGEFFYIQSYYYRGWAKAADIALTDEEGYRKFLPDPSTEGITITADTVALTTGQTLDMGAVFPLVSSTDDTFVIEIPCRGENGIMYTEAAAISKKHAAYGPLPYTMRNFITQAFKLLGTDYSWGGCNEGVDCSGFVCAVFRSLGIYLPRNTGEQRSFVGAVTSLVGLEKEKITEILGNTSYPTAIHRSGHVMLYLGTENGRIHVIHAPTGGKKVSVSELERTDNLLSASMIAPHS